MERESTENRLIVRYLLGDISEEENLRVENRAFAEPAYMDQVLATENDLIDDYVQGRLASSERERFERLFLTSAERREKIDFARALNEVVSDQLPEPQTLPNETGGLSAWLSSLIPSSRGPRMALAFSVLAAVLIGLGALWLASENSRLRRQLAIEREQVQKSTTQQEVAELQRREDELKRQVADQAARNKELEGLIAKLEGQPDQVPNVPGKPSDERSFVALFLLPGAVRGGDQPPRLTIPPGIQSVRVRLGLESTDNYGSFRAEVQDGQDRVIWSRDGLTAQRGRVTRTLTLNIPTPLLTNGKYVIALRGLTASGALEDVNFYPFTVQK